MSTSSKKRLLWIPVLLLALVIGYVYISFIGSNTRFEEAKKYLYIPTGSTYDSLLKQIKSKNLLDNPSSFDQLAEWMNLKDHVRAGKYAVTRGMGNYSLIKMLRSGHQEPVKLVITKVRTKGDIVHRLSKSLETDSLSFVTLFSDMAFMKRHDLDTNQLQCLVMPNTYEVYWNSTAEKVVEKLARYHHRFWNDERLVQARSKGYSKAQICTIASIVEEETLKKEDKYKIASTYFNRLRIGMPLQADPTLKFALQNFALQRILKVHTAVVSPYNTYIHAGLPPGPICTPSEETIDAVLHAPETDYLYFCAKEDFSGYSNFAANLNDHNANARKYQQALNARGIK